MQLRLLAAAFLVGACGSTSTPASSDAGTAVTDAAAPLHDALAPGADAPAPSPEASPTSDGAAPPPGTAAFLTRSYQGRAYMLYVPASYVAGTATPLVMMLHGCTQTMADFAAGTQMNTQADSAGFLVAYPDEPTSANVEQCFNWFLPADQARGAGEPQLLAGMVGDVAGSFTVDATRVFVAGLSSGAAMAVILGATYPDVFAAVGAHSGLEYEAATDETSALTAAESGGPAPKTQGDAAFAAMGTYARPVPVIVFQGTADTTVNDVNGQQIIGQWTETDDRASATIGAGAATQGTAGGKSFTLTTYTDAKSGDAMLEYYLVTGLAHAWSGGSTAGTFTDPDGPDATKLMWSFFAANPK
jgi:poly(hydroxyalkanoate) depolymerase family esterase